MTTFVLVHGAWHGGWCWRRVARELQKSGYDVFTPTLTGLGERAHLAQHRGGEVRLEPLLAHDFARRGDEVHPGAGRRVRHIAVPAQQACREGG
jgi:dienelactone hydrolase